MYLSGRYHAQTKDQTAYDWLASTSRLVVVKQQTQREQAQAEAATQIEAERLAMASKGALS